MMEKVSENQNGNVWHNADIDVSVFEDVQGNTPRYYAWRGTWDDHDSARHTAVCESMDEAVNALCAEEYRVKQAEQLIRDIQIRNIHEVVSLLKSAADGCSVIAELYTIVTEAVAKAESLQATSN